MATRYPKEQMHRIPYTSIRETHLATVFEVWFSGYVSQNRRRSSLSVITPRD